VDVNINRASQRILLRESCRSDIKHQAKKIVFNISEYLLAYPVTLRKHHGAKYYAVTGNFVWIWD
jgi:hypothetical protein